MQRSSSFSCLLLFLPPSPSSSSSSSYSSSSSSSSSSFSSFSSSSSSSSYSSSSSSSSPCSRPTRCGSLDSKSVCSAPPLFLRFLRSAPPLRRSAAASPRSVLALPLSKPFSFYLAIFMFSVFFILCSCVCEVS